MSKQITKSIFLNLAIMLTVCSQPNDKSMVFLTLNLNELHRSASAVLLFDTRCSYFKIRRKKEILDAMPDAMKKMTIVKYNQSSVYCVYSLGPVSFPKQ